MARTHVSTIAVTLTSAIGASIAFPVSIFANPVVPPAVVSAPGFMRDKQSDRDDPLAGLPNEAGDNQRTPSGPGRRNAGKGICALSAGPENNRDIGDLRAALAFAKKGPIAWACARAGEAEIRLRISIDEGGKVTAADTIAGDPGIATAIAKKLSGKAVNPRAAGPTVGVVVVKLANGK